MMLLSFRRYGALLVAVSMAFPLLSCVETESVICPSGRICGPGLMCAAFQDTCINTPCGDGVVQAGEFCDDGNVLDGDGCSRDCRSNESCGDGRLDMEAGEVCDDNNLLSGDGCSADCRSNEVCRNGIVDTSVGEVCDDRNTTPGDGCSSDCRSDERCGNGIVDTAVGEICDDKNLVDGDGCSSNCRSGEGCGNGVRDPEEECDDGNRNDNDNCLNTCVKARCGDGVTDSELPGVEACDSAGESSICNSNCTGRRCGDGIVNRSAGEQCDDSGGLSTPECDSDCTLPVCGDGIKNEVAGEMCDDHNQSNSDDCLDTCQPNTCGDKFIDSEGPEVEICDDGNRVTETACEYGTPTCTACSADCTTQWQLQGPVCGDGIKNGSEECDDGNKDACGTCNAACTVAQLAAATGTITAVDASKIKDEANAKDTFSLSDGLSIPTIFEFSKDDKVGQGHVIIYAGEGSSSDWIAGIIALAINAQGESLRIHATRQGSVVNLAHDLPGTFGNQPIIENVADKSFRVSGMVGGQGRDCPDKTPCRRDDDCASGVCLPALICGEPVSE